jgi:hypothetical protein
MLALRNLKQPFTDPIDRQAIGMAGVVAVTPSVLCDAASPAWPGVQKGILIDIQLTQMNLSGTSDFGSIAELPSLHSVNLKHRPCSSGL